MVRRKHTDRYEIGRRAPTDVVLTEVTNPPISATPIFYNSLNGPSYVRLVRLVRVSVEDIACPLGVTDNKGRVLGHRVAIAREVHGYGNEHAHRTCPADRIDLWIGESFVVTASTQRDGHDFGAIQKDRRVKSLDEARALRDGIFAKARKTASKRSGASRT